MTVTEVTIYGTPRPGFLGYASIVLAGAIKLKHIRLVPAREPDKPIVVLMPSKKKEDGTWMEYYHPISPSARVIIEAAIRAEWSRRAFANPNAKAAD